MSHEHNVSHCLIPETVKGQIHHLQHVSLHSFLSTDSSRSAATQTLKLNVEISVK